MIAGALLIAIACCSGCTTTEIEKTKSYGKIGLGVLTAVMLYSAINANGATLDAAKAQEDYWNRN